MKRIYALSLCSFFVFLSGLQAQQSDPRDVAYDQARRSYKAYLDELKKLNQQYKEVTSEIQKIVHEEGMPVWDETEDQLEIREASSGVFSPADIKETGKEMVVKMDLPGVKRSDLKVSVQDNRILKVYAKRETDFERVIELPGPASEKDLKARLEDGVLTVWIQKGPQTDKEVDVLVE